MTHIFINANNEYPRHIGDILLEAPDYDGTVLPEGWKIVEPTVPPTVGENEVAEEIFPKLINGTYVQSWKIRPITQEEIDFKLANQKRWETLP